MWPLMYWLIPSILLLQNKIRALARSYLWRTCISNARINSILGCAGGRVLELVLNLLADAFVGMFEHRRDKLRLLIDGEDVRDNEIVVKRP